MWLLPPTQDVFSRICVTLFAPNPLCTGQISPKEKFCFSPHLPFNPLSKTSKSEKFLIILAPEQAQSVSSVPIQLTRAYNHQINIAECWWTTQFHFCSVNKKQKCPTKPKPTHMFSWIVSFQHDNKEIKLGMMYLTNEKTWWLHFSHSLVSCLCCLYFLPLYLSFCLSRTQK